MCEQIYLTCVVTNVQIDNLIENNYLLCIAHRHHIVPLNQVHLVNKA